MDNPERDIHHPRVAVVGTGPWGLNHVRTWSQLGFLDTICDNHEARLAHARALAPEAKATSSLTEVLDDPAIQGVVLAVPARLHEDLAIAALAAGKDVLVEKPLALTLRGGQRVEKTANQSGRILAVGHLLEYHPAFLEIRRMLAAGELGRLQYVYSHRLNLGRVRTEENALWSFAPHDVALILRLAGQDPSSVACHGATYLSIGVPDVTTTHLAFPSGVHAHIFVSWLHPFKEHRFVVVGSDGMAVFDDTREWHEKLVFYPHRVAWEHGQMPVARRAEAIAVPLTAVEPLRSECEDFARAITTRIPPVVAGPTGVRVLAVLERAERAMSVSSTHAQGVGAPARVFVHPTATIDAGATIGEGTKLWHHVHVSLGASIGRDCSLGQNAYVGPGVKIGNGVRVQNNVSVYEGVELEDYVFCGPSMVFTNVKNPRAEVERKDEFGRTLIQQGATLGANCTIVCGTTVGRYAMVGAGAVVTRNVAPHAIVAGVPAVRIGWVCECGERLGPVGRAVCQRCGRIYAVAADAVHHEEDQ